jgi:glyoxalase family protein
VTATAFSVPAGSLPWWRDRFTERRVAVTDGTPRFGDEVLALVDPSGLAFELVASGADRRMPWEGSGVDAAHASRGLHSVTLTVASPPETLDFLTRFLGVEMVDKTAGRIRLGANGGGPGRTIDLVSPSDAPSAVNGLGTVHHVAFAVASAEDQRAIRLELLATGWRVTEVMDRQYFQSIYFREPGGVLLEVATVSPGFATDETVPELGQSLKLPPWEESHRAHIETHLPRVVMPGRGPWPTT